jgi:hypothetical protein
MSQFRLKKDEILRRMEMKSLEDGSLQQEDLK